MSKIPAFVCLFTLVSLLLAACGPGLDQKSTLVAGPTFSTLTAEATLKATPVPLTSTSTSTNIPTPASTYTPIPPSTSTPDQTAVAFSQILETATAQAGWKPKLYDTFGHNVFGWCNMRSVATYVDGAKNRFYFDNGVFHMTYTSGEKYSQLWCAPYGTYYDFQVSVLAKFISGDPETSYGVAFRVYQQSFKGFSRFIINPANEYRVDTRDSNGNWVVLQDWTKSNDMKPQGEWNKLTVSAIGPELTFFLNDKFQTYLIYRGADAEKGSIGLVVHGEIPGKSIDVLFDNLTIREP
jgi:hypothetical protein